MIINHTHPDYINARLSMNNNKYNGAYYYSININKHIIPNVKTERSWITVNVPSAEAFDHSIVFIHNNNNAERYSWLKDYKDLILVCGVKSTMEKVKHLGTPIYLPLSIDIAEVEKYRKEKTKDVAYAGRRRKRDCYYFDSNVDFLEGMPRARLLEAMADYKRIYAVGLTAIEAKVLGCEVLPYDPRYPDPSIWEPLDCKDAAKMLQKILDEVDHANR